MGNPQLRRLVQQPANPRIARLCDVGRIPSPVLSLQRVRKPGRFRNDLGSNKPVAIQFSSGVILLGKLKNKIELISCWGTISVFDSKLYPSHLVRAEAGTELRSLQLSF